MDFLYPDQYIKTVHDIDYYQLFVDGYRGIMFDIDNTLAPYDQALPSREVVQLFDHLQQMGFKICLVSNNNAKRVFKFNSHLKVHAYPRANKPITKNLIKAMNKLEVKNKQMIFVGDQLFTDVWAGNSIGFKTILVKPIQDKEQLVTKVKRGLEGLLLKRYLKKKGMTKF